MKLITKIKVGNEEFDEIEVFPETAGTMAQACYYADNNEAILGLARAVSRTKIKGLDSKKWNLKTAKMLSADDYIALWSAIGEFDKNFTPEPTLILQ